jgi:hypothetical protein
MGSPTSGTRTINEKVLEIASIFSTVEGKLQPPITDGLPLEFIMKSFHFSQQTLESHVGGLGDPLYQLLLE